ncbi:hypothetical protein BGZ91_002268, partial [Linnemannia elongata]
MGLVSTVAIATSLLLFTSQNLAYAQDANCSAIYNDFAPSSTPSSIYQKCYTDQAYNTALVLQGVNPNYSDILSQICSRPASIYLTSGTIRAAQAPFFETLDQTDTCSPCSQRIISASVSYLSENLMPRIGPFYTPEFVQYWTKLVVAYNALCKTSLVQSWPEGTLNVTTVPVPAPSTSPSSPAAAEPAAPASTVGPSNAGRSPRGNSATSSYSVSPGFVVASVVVAVGASVA